MKVLPGSDSVQSRNTPLASEKLGAYKVAHVESLSNVLLNAPLMKTEARASRVIPRDLSYALPNGPRSPMRGADYQTKLKASRQEEAEEASDIANTRLFRGFRRGI